MTSTAVGLAPPSAPARHPPLQMRGGLGRTLLTAFLLLAIGPLSLVGSYAVVRSRAQNEQERHDLLAALSAAYGARVEAWYQHELASLQQIALRPPASLPHATWRVSSPDDRPPDLSPDELERLASGRPFVADLSGRPALWNAIPAPDGALLVARRPLPLLRPDERLPGLGPGSRIALATSEAVWSLDGGETPAPIPQAGPLDTPRQWTFDDHGDLVFVSRKPLPPLSAALLVLQPRSEATNSSETLAATLIAATLLAALLTAVAAAVVTRQITRPLFELTRTAAYIARGDLAHRARVDRQDELGILALAFNVMADRLQDLLATLEQRVAERTAELQAANAQIERRARQLATSAEIGREINQAGTVNRLLQQSVELIHRRLGLAGAGLWLLPEPGNADNRLRMISTAGADVYPEAIAAAAAREGNIFAAGPENAPIRLGAEERAEIIALPLRVGARTLGALTLRDPGGFDEGDTHALQTVADQVAIAIENTRASEIERAAANKLRELEARRSASLGQMSHELSTSLTNIIGFSRLLLKEVEGPLTEMQRSDLTYINRNGHHLLQLLDRMLDLIEPGQGQGEPAGDEPNHSPSAGGSYGADKL